MQSDRDDPLKKLDVYWDAIVRGQDPPEAIDPVLAGGIALTRIQDDATGPDSTFVKRLEEELMSQLTLAGTTSVRSLPVTTRPLNGHVSLIPAGRRHGAAQAARRRLLRGQWAVARAASAAMLLVILTGGFVLYNAGPFGSKDRFSASIPAPVISPEASPSVGPITYVWQSSGDPASPLDFPSRPAVAPDGSIWVPDTGNGVIQYFSSEGALIETWGEPGSGNGQFDFRADGMLGGYPEGAISFDTSGNFYVADTGNHRIQKFGPDRGFLLAWGSEGTGDGQFLGATDVVVDPDGRVYVVDGNRGGEPDMPNGIRVNAIQVFDGDGAFIASWGPTGSNPGELSSPTGLGIDLNGNVLVTDIDNSRVQRFDPDGVYLDGWGGFGIGQREFSLPVDVTVDSAGRIYVVDWSSNSFKIFTNDGRFLDEWNGIRFRDGQLKGPSGIAVDGDGGIYVTDNSGRLQKYRLEGTG